MLPVAPRIDGDTMAARKRVTLAYDPEQLAAVLAEGQEATFGARVIGLLLGGRGAIDRLPLAFYGIECEYLPGEAGDGGAVGPADADGARQ